jgi:pyruvate dehydrogenase E2 component (dihydrolipoamide acetyltransferase)
MAKEIIMPRFGMTQEEATIVHWIVKDGQPVESGDPICEVTTDKVNMEVEAPADGILAGIRFGEGETVPVTEIIAYIVAEGESPPAVEPRKIRPPSSQQPEPPELQPAVHIPGDGKDINATPVALRMAAIEEIELSAVPGSGPAGKVTRQDVEHYLEGGRDPASIQTEGGKVRASPAARRLARQQGVGLSQIRGSGPNGRIQGWDIPEIVSSQIGIPAGVQPTVIELQGIRATIAERMQTSWQTIPHIMFSVDIDMSRAIAMRESLNERYGDQKSTISITAVLVKACAAALQQHPQLNSYFIDDQILLMPDINLGVAVALDEGLIVPVVRQADLKSLYQIGGEVSDLSNRARGGDLRPEDVVDGTFTISNLGMFSVDQFTAIINPPQVAILAVGRTEQRFVPNETGQPVLRPMMTVTLSADHRAVDGALAARFLTTVKGIIETAGSQWG